MKRQIHTGKYIAYYRVSTKEQGDSGYGLEAQREAVFEYLKGEKQGLINEYTEVISGTKKARPQLELALAECKKQRAKLVVSKLDRLARNVYVMAKLMESGVDFVAVDNPHANKFTIQILSAVAEHERDLISERTRRGLAVAKAKGVVLGKYAKTEIAKQARERDAKVIDQVLSVRKTLRKKSHSALAKKLNEKGIKTPNGGKWQAIQVIRLLDRHRTTKKKIRKTRPYHPITHTPE